MFCTVEWGGEAVGVLRYFPRDEKGFALMLCLPPVLPCPCRDKEAENFKHIDGPTVATWPLSSPPSPLSLQREGDVPLSCFRCPILPSLFYLRSDKVKAKFKHLDGAMRGEDRVFPPCCASSYLAPPLSISAATK